MNYRCYSGFSPSQAGASEQFNPDRGLRSKSVRPAMRGSGRVSVPRGLSRSAVFALRGEEIGPRHHLGVLLEQGAALTLSHPAPHAELDPVVQSAGGAFEDHRTTPADHRGFALRGAADEPLIRVGGATAGFGHPGQSVFGLGTVDWAVSRDPRCWRHDAAFTYSSATRFTHCLASSRLHNGSGSGRNSIPAAAASNGVR